MAKITETELLKRGFVYNGLLDSYDLLYMNMDMDNGARDRITVKKKGSTKKWKATFYKGFKKTSKSLACGMN